MTMAEEMEWEIYQGQMEKVRELDKEDRGQHYKVSKPDPLFSALLMSFIQQLALTDSSGL